MAWLRTAALGFGPVKNMYAGIAYIGNRREGNCAASNAISKHLSYGLGDFDLGALNRFGSQGYSSSELDEAKSFFKTTAIVSGVLAALFGATVGTEAAILATAFGSDAVDTIIPVIMSLTPVVKDIYDERPSETISLALNITNIFANHDSDLVVAHLKAQDQLYIDGYNKKNPDKKIDLVPLLDNADMGRAVLDSYNQVKLWTNNGQTPSKKDSDLRVNIEGFTFGLSKVHKVESGFAAGYYSYASKEKMEVFFHTDDHFIIEYESFSKKFWDHDVILDVYYHHSGLTPNAEGNKMVIEERLYHDKQEVWLGAGPYTYNPGMTLEELLESKKK